MADATGQADLRAENFSRIVKGFALQEYKMKQLCMVENSNSWTETFYKETAADLTGGTGSAVEGVPRLAQFPYGEVTWTKTSGRNVKHAMEGQLSWEDVKTNNVPMIARTLLRIARAVAKSVDTEIASKILSEAGNTTAANATWNNAVIADRQPIQDILDAKALIAIDNYNPDKNGHLLVHPTNYAELLGNSAVRNAAEFWTDSVTKNGRVGMLLGLTVVVTNSVTEGGAQVVIGKEACTWKSVSGLSVKTIEDPGISYKIRAWEVGQIQVVNPDAICSITGV
jgi:hypothetical protein|tara:strand:+ start:624 stop:1472 length:849 start_codon:yes stop_codon:yes gene_type:complete